FPPVFNEPASDQKNTTDLQRVSFYGYYHWRVWERFRLIAGVSYDRLLYPRNIDLPPISDGQQGKDQVSPKVGLQWQPCDSTTLRGAYTRSLGGLFYDVSVR